VIIEEIWRLRIEALRVLPTGAVLARPHGVDHWPSRPSAEDVEAVIEWERLHGGPNAEDNIRAARAVLSEIEPEEP
jgi:hypothetical protein